VDYVALGQVCGGQSGTVTGLWWTEWHWGRFVVDRVALGQVCCGQSGTVTGLWWTEWRWGRFVVDRVALWQVSLTVLRFYRQYHSTNAPYSFIHLPPTLYNVSLPVLQFPLSVSFHQCSILIHTSTTIAVYCFSPSTSGLPCQYHSTNAPYSVIHLPPTLYHVSLPVLQFSLSVSFHQCSILIFFYFLLLRQRQTGESREPSNKAMLFQICGRYSVT
jgi:hypothetical protein